MFSLSVYQAVPETDTCLGIGQRLISDLALEIVDGTTDSTRVASSSIKLDGIEGSLVTCLTHFNLIFIVHIRNAKQW